MLRSRAVQRTRLLMSTPHTLTAPQRFQFRLRSMLILTVIVGLISAVDAAALRTEQLPSVMYYSEWIRLLCGVGGGAWAAWWASARGVASWRVVLGGAALGGVLTAIAYAPLSLPEARESDLFYLPARMCPGPSPAPPSVWPIAAELILHKGLFTGALLGAATALLSSRPGLLRASMSFGRNLVGTRHVP